MLSVSAINQLELRWEPPLEEYVPTAHSQEFRLQLLVDGQPLLNDPENYYAYDLGELVQSVSSDGLYYILTCECGTAECIGITEAVAVRQQDNFIEWNIKSPFSLSLCFDYQMYAATIHVARKNFLQFLPQVSTALQEGDIRLLPDNFWYWPFVQGEI